MHRNATESPAHACPQAAPLVARGRVGAGLFGLGGGTRDKLPLPRQVNQAASTYRACWRHHGCAFSSGIGSRGRGSAVRRRCSPPRRASAPRPGPARGRAPADLETARDLHERLMPVWDAIGVDNMPSLCKYAQSLQGLDAGLARKPTSPVRGDQKTKVRAALAGLGLIDAP